MTIPSEAMVAATYAMFALQQPISMDELAAGGRDRTFPVASTRTPNWFAAAASTESSILETAPELLVLDPGSESGDAVDVTGIDLIHVYAPELESLEAIEETPEPVPRRPAPDAQGTPRTSTQFGLLKELSNLDQ